MEYEFTLKFALPANHRPADELIERLGEAGCEDALVGIGPVSYTHLMAGPSMRRAPGASRAGLRS